MCLEEGRRQKEEGRRQKAEGRKAEGRRKKGRRENCMGIFFDTPLCVYKPQKILSTV
ncbi:hypothetical protein [Okeania sp. SIO3B5]|uniref:hypothetical protein n=1 Tax=Okeania sp. SIO3B5 TaxID=2607811 RepID=UPI0025CB7F1F|nr:hypothetical protein [Okeania sp. SIO3B5]